MRGLVAALSYSTMYLDTRCRRTMKCLHGSPAIIRSIISVFDMFVQPLDVNTDLALRNKQYFGRLSW